MYVIPMATSTSTPWTSSRMERTSFPPVTTVRCSRLRKTGVDVEVAIGIAAVASPVFNRVERLHVFQGDLINVGPH
jgi:hypothetical protein